MTQQEKVAFVEQHYPIRGGEWVARRLGTSAENVRNIASAHGIVYGLTATRVAVNKVAKLAGHSWGQVYNAAKADGVLARITSSARQRALVTVPLTWADTYVEKFTGLEHSTLISEGWLTMPDLAKEFGLSRNYLLGTRAKGTGPLYELVSSMRVIEVPRGQLVWRYYHPQDAVRVASEIRSRRARARRMVSVKELSAQIDRVGYPMVFKRMRSYDSFELLPRGTRIMGHVSQAHAREILAYYGVYPEKHE